MGLSAKQASPENVNRKTFPEMLWDSLACFRSIQLAIVLLSLMAIGILIGVMMPQEGLVAPLEIKHNFGANYRLYKSMGLFNVYSSYWFITLEVLFFFNLLIGSFKWLKPAFLAATRKTFLPPSRILAAQAAGKMKSPFGQAETVQQLSRLLKKHRYGVYAEGQQTVDPGTGQAYQALYATKGNFSRFGPVIAHFGILCLLIASVAAAFTGFKAQKVAVPGETFNIMQANTFVPNVNPKVWQGSVPTWKFKVEDFRIEYYPDHPETVKQYFCTLSVTGADGKLKARKTISVNDPLSVQDLTVYQASFTPTGKLFMEINGKPRTVEINSQFQQRPISMVPIEGNLALVVFPFFVQQDPMAKQNHVMMFLSNGKGFLGAAPGKMPTNLRLNEGESGVLKGIRIKYVKPEIATGLQIKKAPEVPYMYAAYLIIILGTVVCFFSQRQLWIGIRNLPDGGGCEVSFLHKTNKARLSFNKELAVLEAALQRQWRVLPGEVLPGNEEIETRLSDSRSGQEVMTR